MTRLPLARAQVDRAAHRRGDADWQRESWAKGRVLVVDDGKVLVRGSARPEGAGGEGGHDALVFLDADQAPDGERYFLGVDAADVPYYAVSADLPEVPGTTRADLRRVGESLDDRDAGLVTTAVALANWHARHPFSPLSGDRTTLGEAGWTRVTDNGDETLWPRTDPAVIMLVHDGVPGPEGRCLLGHNASWTAPGWENRYSCLAGFVEPGESAEASVAREVAEEVGIAVRDIRYVASQPWPFPGSLMLGFHALADPTAELRPDSSEITHARWFTRTEIGAALTGQPVDFGLPGSISIAHYLVTYWHSARP